MNLKQEMDDLQQQLNAAMSAAEQTRSGVHAAEARLRDAAAGRAGDGMAAAEAAAVKALAQAELARLRERLREHTAAVDAALGHVRAMEGRLEAARAAKTAAYAQRVTQIAGSIAAKHRSAPATGQLRTCHCSLDLQLVHAGRAPCPLPLPSRLLQLAPPSSTAHRLASPWPCFSRACCAGGGGGGAAGGPGWPEGAGRRGLPLHVVPALPVRAPPPLPLVLPRMLCPSHLSCRVPAPSRAAARHALPRVS